VQKVCTVTGQPFEVSPRELALREKLEIGGEPDLHPVFRFMKLGAFWQHWNLHKRTCDKTGKEIIAVYPQNCVYPIWHKDEWIKHADPPGSDFDSSQEVFPQLWEFFQKSPIAHNIGTNCDNCEYCDDWWFSRNCYLCHSGYNDEDLRYCYRVIDLKNCEYCVFSFKSELSCDLINSHNCFQCRFMFNCWHCRDSNFCYDCRNCTNCFLCSNLRKKEYCIRNKQYSKEEYEQMMSEFDLSLQNNYSRAKEEFDKLLHAESWHRALEIEECENATGNYLKNCKNCENCYFIHDMDNCVNIWRGAEYVKDSLDSVSPAFKCELLYNSSLPQNQCYKQTCCADVTESQWMEYCTHCTQCRYCFGCCGLVGKEYYIFNKPYSKEDYKTMRDKIVGHMRKTGEWSQFFPGHFAANNYDESLAGFYWPLTDEQANKYGFRTSQKSSQKSEGLASASEIPNDTKNFSEADLSKVYWDETLNRPFQIQKADLSLADSLKAPPPNTYYMTRIKNNFRYISFNGETRATTCNKCSNTTPTCWPVEYDGRILCEECYLKEVY